MRRRAIVRLLLCLVAIGTVLGHVCALPHRADAATTPVDQHDGHEGAEHDALHAGSCDALRASPVQLRVVTMPAASVITEVVAPGPSRWSHGRSRFEAGESPPLFLLHRALLI
jgi:hypothetical protein